MDITEWDITTTSDKCEYRIYIEDFSYIESFSGKEHTKLIEQCAHPYNDSRACVKCKCPIKTNV